MHISFEDTRAGKTTPKEAIVFYGHFAVHVPLVKQGATLTCGAPKQLEAADLRRMLASIDFEFVPSLFQHEHVLAYDETRTIWYTKASEQVLYFRTDDSALQAISGQVFPQPALLFVAKKGSLQVHALPSNDRPTPETPLLVAPYYNTSDGRVCIGTTPLPKFLHPDNTSTWVEAFFSSSFTHGSHKRIQAHPGSHAEMWLDVQKAGHFSTEHLLPTKLTLGDLLK